MISYYDGQLADIFPSNISMSEEVQALSYALQQATQLLYRYSQRLYIYDNLDRQPEEVIDLLASELRTQYYRSDMELETKRRLVKNTLIWYMSAGTPAAVEELVTNVFGSGDVQEWFEYGGKPYCFLVSTDVHMDPESMAEFSRMIRKVKNTRSHLEALEFRRNLRQQLYSGSACIVRSEVEIECSLPEEAYRGGIKQRLYYCGAVQAVECIVECICSETAEDLEPPFRFEVRGDGHLWAITEKEKDPQGVYINEEGHLIIDTAVVPNAGKYRIREDGHLVYG